MSVMAYKLGEFAEDDNFSANFFLFFFGRYKKKPLFCVFLSEGWFPARINNRKSLW
jgi:hypothetical protein